MLSDSESVYVLDPDAAMGQALATLLGSYGIDVQVCDVQVCVDVETFLSSLASGCIKASCLIIEANLPECSGLDLLRKVNEMEASPPVILLTENASSEFRKNAQVLGAAAVLEKPLLSEYLLERLASLLPNANSLPETGLQGIELEDGHQVWFRVMRPEDADIEQAFVRDLSAKSRYLRFFSNINELTPEMLERFTRPDYPRSYAIIATIMDEGRERQVGVARYAPTDQDGVAEFAVVVADDWQGLGIASHLMQGLTTAAALAGISRLEGQVLRENDPMLKLAQTQGFSTGSCKDDPTMLCVVKTLRGSIDP